MWAPDPAWLAEVPADKQKAAKTQFLLRLAALYHNPGGSVATLGHAMNRSGNGMYKVGTISPNTAVAVEALLGKELFHRSFFRPDLFEAPSKQG